MNKTLITALILSFTLFLACDPKKKTSPEPEGPFVYGIPNTYNFENTNFSGQITRLDMLGELSSYMKTARTKGVLLSANKLKEMFTNSNSPFAAVALNTSGKNLKDKVYASDQAILESYMDSLAAISGTLNAGSVGVVGIVKSPNDSAKKYLCNAQGVEYSELIDKGMFGSLIYYQAMNYLDNLPTKDNTTIIPGEGTVMEHNTDEAFGYFGVPVDFPSNTTNLRAWGNYCNRRNALLNTNKTIMDAFLLCRAAISNKDYAKRDEAIKLVKDSWEKVIAATVINYLNTAKNNMADDAIRNHNLSECLGFVKSLQYKSDKKISNAQISQVLNFMGNNFYTITVSNINQARDLISAIYGLDSLKNTL
jgi:hypothetical protein